jgi:hypothetical protein
VQAPSQASQVHVAEFAKLPVGQVDPHAVPDRKKLVLQAVQGLGVFVQIVHEVSHWMHLF